jgi:hypothetical protein
MSSTDTAVLLTATVSVGGMIATRRADPAVRLADYAGALTRWLAQRDCPPLVFCESSGHDLADLERIARERNPGKTPVEFLSFSGNTYPPGRGKGYGEMGIMDHALAHSRLLSAARMILKVTGRLVVPNAARIAGCLSLAGIQVYCDLRDNLVRADSRVFAASPEFLREFLLPLREQVDDARQVSFEHVLARAVHLALAGGACWALLPEAPDIRGVSATTDEAYPSSWLSRLRRALFRRIKASVLDR